jgi:hypothetical protein
MTARIRDWQRRPIRKVGEAGSKREARGVAELRLRQKAGEITGLKTQVRVPLWGQFGAILTQTGRHMAYVADATFYEDGALVIWDSKGFKTEVYLMKRAILAAMNITVREA